MKLSELEEQLATPDGPRIKEDKLHELKCLQDTLKQQLKTPRARAEFALTKALADAAQAAHEILSRASAGYTI
jgi:hypothetical protein